MKKRICIFLICILLLLAAGCGKAEDKIDEKEDATVPSQSTTLMVYMIGSDLESKSGAGTEDLQEMVESNVDLSRINVLVYAGGSPNWHNDMADSQKHTLLRLTESGFETITATDTYSMGLSQCLSSFLNYGYENFPADQYGLILWNHGNGPVIGFGKDMLFDYDCLTLHEMSQALADSPFHSENKLSWVGFDACLMASAELACVWAPYADYLVASQEVEPSFGWNYSFLSELGSCDTPTLLKTITNDYLQDCLAYFQERGYEDRDTTLSCLDLSKTESLENAIDALFTKAAADVSTQYNQLTARRANTRALGRASTGSEYDLVDLQDMAMWLGEMYPQEATDLIEAIESMVTANATNAQGLCGISLYYPFHNKHYYASDWSEAYSQLGAFPAYQQYLGSYEEIWLGNDKLDSATSETPEEDNGVFSLQLTQEQADNLASARYHILTRDGEEYFTQIFASSDVENQDGLLTAGFDGNILYVTNEFGTYHIPVSIETDRVGDVGRYIVPVVLANGCIDLILPKDYPYESEGHRYYLNIHKDSGEITISTLTPHNSETDGDLVGGKKTDSDLSQWSNAYFFHNTHRFLSRYDNGAIKPVGQWPEDTLISGRSYALEHGIEFVYAPLVSGEYYLLFEMEDTQGNRYCSELLPIQTNGTLPEVQVTPEPVYRDWDSGEEILLTDEFGVKIWLKKVFDFGSEGYMLKAENSNDYPVVVSASDLYWGEDTLCRSTFSYINVGAGETAENDVGLDFGVISAIGLTEPSGEMTFHLNLMHGITGFSMLYQVPYTVALSQSTMLQPSEVKLNYSRFDQPILECRADSQILWESEDLRIQLLGLGNNGIDKDIRGVLLAENLSQLPITISMEGICLDTTFVPIYATKLTIPPGKQSYVDFTANNYDMRYAQLTSASAIQLLVRQYEYNPLFSGNTHSQILYCNVELAESGVAGTIPAGKLLYNKDGIRVSLIDSKSEYGYKSIWYLAVTNTTGQDIALKLTDRTVDGEPVTKFLSISDNCIPAGMSAVCEISHSNYETKEPANKVSFRFWVMDFKQESILSTLDQVITLTAPKESS